MVPTSEDVIHEVRRRPGQSTRELAKRFGVGPDDFPAFAGRLLDLEVEGEVLRLPGGGWVFPEETEYRVGRIRLSRRGDAFLVPAKPDRRGDLYIPPGSVRDAFEDDSVLVRITARPHGKKRERGPRGPRLRTGEVVDVVRRSTALIRGQFWAAGMPPEAGALPEAVHGEEGARRRGRRGKSSRPSRRTRVEAEARARAEEPGGTGAKRRGPVPGFVRPLRSHVRNEVFVAAEDSQGARDGEKVLVRLLDRPPFGTHPRGQVVLKVEEEGSIESDFHVIAAEFGFPVEHPADALAEAEAFPSLDGGIPPGALEGRTDLRGLRVFTIDPEDARDFDDAVSLETLPGGDVRLGVHIADVSHYIPSGSALDRSAAERGTSIYLPGRVVPMLPERLSNDLCSLRPDTDRLAKTVFMDFAPDGRPVASSIFRSVIRNRRRFTYPEVLAILDEVDRRRGVPPPGSRAVYPRDRRAAAEEAAHERDGQPLLPADAGDHMDVLAAMADLRDRLWRARHERGAMDLDIPRLRLRVGEEGKVLAIERDERDPSHHLIEEFMLAANEAVARSFGEKEIPLVSRVHPPPDEDRIEDFFCFLEAAGFRLGRAAASRDLQRIVEETAGEPLAPIVHLALLRSLAHAEYAAEPGIHFALATAHYCHFTSPIRRYPDLLVHQSLDEHWDGKSLSQDSSVGPRPSEAASGKERRRSDMVENIAEEERRSITPLEPAESRRSLGIGSKLRGARRRRRWDEVLPELAAESSHAEVRAEQAEREMTKLRLIRHLAPRVGEEMDGMIVSVHPFGFFVRADESNIEGLVHVATLGDDYYEYDEDRFCLRGTGRRRTFKMGDRVRVALSELDADFREIGFRFIARATA